MLDVDKKLIEAEEKAIVKEAEKFYKLRDQRKIFNNLVSPKFYLSEIADSFRKSRLVQFSALTPIATGALMGIGGAVTGMAGSGSALAFAGVAVSNGIIVGGIASLSVATVKVAGKIGKCLKQLDGYNPIKAEKQERRLMFSMRDRHLKIKHMEAVFSDKEDTRPPLQERTSRIRVIKSSSDLLSEKTLKSSKEKVRE
ncbi:MAG: hypothetical protein IJC30_00375 [Alphaproteobacteria bacterium]|nr:hypothetical protein [Alphaproteobacteria bacterium]